MLFNLGARKAWRIITTIVIAAHGRGFTALLQSPTHAPTKPSPGKRSGSLRMSRSSELPGREMGNSAGAARPDLRRLSAHASGRGAARLTSKSRPQASPHAPPEHGRPAGSARRPGGREGRLAPPRHAPPLWERRERAPIRTRAAFPLFREVSWTWVGRGVACGGLDVGSAVVLGKEPRSPVMQSVTPDLGHQKEDGVAVQPQEDLNTVGYL